jgi:uncharacterized protein involved in outer membrane biogenesis
VRALFATLGLAAAVILLGVLPVNVGFLRGFIETAVSDTTGLEFRIGGPIKLSLGAWPSVATAELVLGDVSRNPLVVVDALQAKIALSALIRGQVHVLELEADGIAVDYCSPFPEFADTPAGDTAAPSVAIDAVAITRVSVRCGPSPGADPMELVIEQALASAPRGAAVQLNAAGAAAGLMFELTATGGELNDLIAATKPFPVQAALSSDAAMIEASGQLVMSPPGPLLDADVDVRAADVQAIAKAFDIELPALGSLDMRGRMRGDPETMELVALEGNIGDSRFAIDAVMDMTADRMRAEVHATLEMLDVAPLLDAGPIAGAPGPGFAGDDIEFDALLAWLDALDTNLQLSVRDVRGLPIDVGAVNLHAELADSDLTLLSATARVFGGEISASGKLTGRVECPELKLLVRASDLDLATLSPLLELDQPLGGRAGGVSLESTSCGTRLFAHRDSLRANATFSAVRMSTGDEQLPLLVDNLALSVMPGERLLGRVQGKLMGENLDATIAIGSLAALHGSDTWPMSIDARGGGARVRVDGRARLPPEDLLVNAHVKFDAPTFGSLQGTSRMQLDESRIVVEDIAITLGQSDLGGRAAWSYAQEPDLLDLTVRSDKLDLAEIAALLPPAESRPDSTQSSSGKSDSRRAVTLPAVDVDLKFRAIHADQLDLQDLSVAAGVRKGLVDDARVSVRLEDEVQLDGTLDLDARQLPARAKIGFTAADMDIGRVLSRLGVAGDLRLRADVLDVFVTTEGSTPQQLLTNTLIRADLQGFDWIIPKTGLNSGADDKDVINVSLSQVRLTTAPNKPMIWSSRGRVDDTDVELWVESPPLEDSFRDTMQFPITVVAAADEDVAMIEARIDRSAAEHLVANISLSGEVIDKQDRSLSELASPLGDYQVQGEITLGESTLHLPDLKMRLGSSAAEGSLAIDGSGPRTRYDASLRVPYLQTDDLLYWSRNNAEETLDGDERGVLFLARDLIAAFRENNDLEFSVVVDELRAGSAPLGGGEVRLYLDEDDFLLKPLKFSPPGGGVNAEYTASTRNGRLEAGLKIRADALVYGGLLRLADHESLANGVVYLDTAISATTAWSPGEVPLNLLFENADGFVSLAAWPENIETGVLDLWTANVVFALLPKSEAGTRSRLNCIVTRFDVEDGVMKSRTTLLDTTDTIIRGRGTIDLRAEQLDLLVWPQAKRERFLSVSTPVTVTGTFDDFGVGVEPVGIIGMLIKWYTSLVYVPYKWLTGQRFPADGTATCFDAMDWELTPELQDYFLERDFSAPPAVR